MILAVLFLFFCVLGEFSQMGILGWVWVIFVGLGDVCEGCGGFGGFVGWGFVGRGFVEGRRGDPCFEGVGWRGFELNWSIDDCSPFE